MADGESAGTASFRAGSLLTAASRRKQCHVRAGPSHTWAEGGAALQRPTGRLEWTMAKEVALGLIEGILGPDDVKGLPPERLEGLAEEIRAFLVENVSKTGGHLGPNLGVVELTIALHRVFSSPSDVLVFDTGHQSYVHKSSRGAAISPRCARKAGCRGIPRAKSRSTTSSKTRTPPPRSPGPTGSPVRLSFAERIAESWPS